MQHMNQSNLDDSYEQVMRDRLKNNRVSLDSSVDSEMMEQQKYMPAVDEEVFISGTDMNRSFIQRINKIEN